MRFGAEICHEIIECLITALEAKDPYTKGHSTRVADLAYSLGELLGLSGKDIPLSSRIIAV